MKSCMESIALGREALARGGGRWGGLPDSPVAGLLALLWYEEREVRQSAVRSLPGGDRLNYHEMHYGYFAEAFLRELTTRHSPAPTLPMDRYGAAAEALAEIIGQSARDIRSMSGMNYSFLSSALYLALVATCRDALLAAARLRANQVHAVLCDLFWNLATVTGIGRLNGKDMLLLADTAGIALASLAPDEIPLFWEALSHSDPARRAAVTPALRHLCDPRAVPYLLNALPIQQPAIAEPILVCLGRLGDARALPLLGEFRRSSHRILVHTAGAAIEAIQRAQKHQPVQTLLRPSTPDPQELLRSVRGIPAVETDPLLRPRLPLESEGGY